MVTIIFFRIPYYWSLETKLQLKLFNIFLSQCIQSLLIKTQESFSRICTGPSEAVTGGALQESVQKNYAKFISKTPLLEALFNKVSGG